MKLVQKIERKLQKLEKEFDRRANQPIALRRIEKQFSALSRKLEVLKR